MIPFLVNGVVIGAIYGIVALGLVLIHKGTRVINFAHGEMGMVGAFVTYSLWLDQHWPFLVCVAFGLLTSAAIGWGVERSIIRKMESASRLAVLVATLGVAGVLQFVAGQIWGLNAMFVPPPIGGSGITWGDVVLTPSRLLVLGAAAILSLGLMILFQRTSFGLAFRGMAIDREVAELAGINVRRLSSITWIMGALLSCVAAILIAPLVTFNTLFMTVLFLRAIAAALLSGLTNLGGAFLAGLLIGEAESVLATFTTQTGTIEAGLFAFIIFLLVLRPQGVFVSA